MSNSIRLFLQEVLSFITSYKTIIITAIVGIWGLVYGALLTRYVLWAVGGQDILSIAYRALSITVTSVLLSLALVALMRVKNKES